MWTRRQAVVSNIGPGPERTLTLPIPVSAQYTSLRLAAQAMLQDGPITRVFISRTLGGTC